LLDTLNRITHRNEQTNWLMPTLTTDHGTLNWRERLDWWAWKLLQRAKRRLFGAPKRKKAAVKYGAENYPDLSYRPEPEVSLEYESDRDAAITLKIIFDHYGDGHPIHFTRCLIIFNVAPDVAPEDELVYIHMKGKEAYEMDLSEMLAAGIGWEMTSWTVFKLFDLDTVTMFDDMVMHNELKQEWFLPIPEMVQ